MEQGIQARDKVLEALLEASDVPVPEALVEAEVHPHLESEDRLEDHEHGAEVGESARKGLQTQFLLDAIVGAGEGLGRPAGADRVPRHERRAVRHGAGRVRQGGRGGRAGAGHGRRGRPSQGARRWLEKATVTDASGTVDLSTLFASEDDQHLDELPVEESGGRAAGRRSRPRPPRPTPPPCRPPSSPTSRRTTPTA